MIFLNLKKFMENKKVISLRKCIQLWKHEQQKKIYIQNKTTLKAYGLYVNLDVVRDLP